MGASALAESAAVRLPREQKKVGWRNSGCQGHRSVVVTMVTMDMV